MQLAFLDFVQFLLEARGEGDVENVLETVYQEAADAFTEHGGREAALIFFHVFALDNSGNDRGVGGRAANALFFQILDQRRLGVTRRRLGEMLLGADFTELKRLAFADARQSVAFAFITLLVVIAIGIGGGQLIDTKVTVEFLHRTSGAERIIARRNVDRGLIENRREHLRSHKALPDQLIQLEEIVVEKFADVFGSPRNISRANRFVRFLGVLFGFVVVRPFRQIIRAETFRNQLAHLRQRVLRNVDRIRAHVRDQRDGPFGTEFDAFVQALRDAHGALRGVAKAVVSGLL